MSVILDPRIIESFRSRVNQDDFAYYRYQDIDGKDKWGCICSAMDWIEVAIEFLNSDWNTSNNLNIKCMNLYTYISSIDILWEAIKQLHRVITDDKEELFDNKRDCFSERINNENDNTYFKTIRACFGAHPVNLDEPTQKGNKSLRRFASWPFDGKNIFSKADFHVRLYSNQTVNNDINFGIHINELEQFALERYEYLIYLISVIDQQYIDFIKDYRDTPILKDIDIVKNLEILKDECEQRLNIDYYTFSIKKLLIIYRIMAHSPQNNLILTSYKKDLLTVINEIYNNLQNMNLVELASDNILSPQCPSALHYSYEKLSNSMWGGSPLYSEDALKDYLRDVLDFSSIESIEELYVLVNAGLNWLHKQIN